METHSALLSARRTSNWYVIAVLPVTDTGRVERRDDPERNTFRAAAGTSLLRRVIPAERQQELPVAGRCIADN